MLRGGKKITISSCIVSLNNTPYSTITSTIPTNYNTNNTNNNSYYSLHTLNNNVYNVSSIHNLKYNGSSSSSFFSSSTSFKSRRERLKKSFKSISFDHENDDNNKDDITEYDVDEVEKPTRILKRNKQNIEQKGSNKRVYEPVVLESHIQHDDLWGDHLQQKESLDEDILELVSKTNSTSLLNDTDVKTSTNININNDIDDQVEVQQSTIQSTNYTNDNNPLNNVDNNKPTQPPQSSNLNEEQDDEINLKNKNIKNKEKRSSSSSQPTPSTTQINKEIIITNDKDDILIGIQKSLQDIEKTQSIWQSDKNTMESYLTLQRTHQRQQQLQIDQINNRLKQQEQGSQEIQKNIDELKDIVSKYFDNNNRNNNINRQQINKEDEIDKLTNNTTTIVNQKLTRKQRKQEESIKWKKKIISRIVGCLKTQGMVCTNQVQIDNVLVDSTTRIEELDKIMNQFECILDFMVPSLPFNELVKLSSNDTYPSVLEWDKFFSKYRQPAMEVDLTVKLTDIVQRKKMRLHHVYRALALQGLLDGVNGKEVMGILNSPTITLEQIRELGNRVDMEVRKTIPSFNFRLLLAKMFGRPTDSLTDFFETITVRCSPLPNREAVASHLYDCLKDCGVYIGDSSTDIIRKLYSEKPLTPELMDQIFNELANVVKDASPNLPFQEMINLITSRPIRIQVRLLLDKYRDEKSEELKINQRFLQQKIMFYLLMHYDLVDSTVREEIKLTLESRTPPTSSIQLDRISNLMESCVNKFIPSLPFNQLKQMMENDPSLDYKSKQLMEFIYYYKYNFKTNNNDKEINEKELEIDEKEEEDLEEDVEKVKEQQQQHQGGGIKLKEKKDEMKKLYHVMFKNGLITSTMYNNVHRLLGKAKEEQEIKELGNQVEEIAKKEIPNIPFEKITLSNDIKNSNYFLEFFAKYLLVNHQLYHTSNASQGKKLQDDQYRLAVLTRLYIRMVVNKLFKDDEKHIQDSFNDIIYGQKDLTFKLQKLEFNLTNIINRECPNLDLISMVDKLSTGKFINPKEMFESSSSSPSSSSNNNNNNSIDGKEDKIKMIINSLFKNMVRPTAPSKFILPSSQRLSNVALVYIPDPPKNIDNSSSNNNNNNSNQQQQDADDEFEEKEISQTKFIMIIGTIVTVATSIIYRDELTSIIFK